MEGWELECERGGGVQRGCFVHNLDIWAWVYADWICGSGTISDLIDLAFVLVRNRHDVPGYKCGIPKMQIQW